MSGRNRRAPTPEAWRTESRKIRERDAAVQEKKLTLLVTPGRDPVLTRSF